MFCAYVLPAVAADYWSSGRDTYNGQYKPSGADSAERESKIPVKKWLILFGTLSGFALLLLIVLEIGGGGLLPEAIENIIAKICVVIIAITLCLFFYYLTSIFVFLIMIPIAPAAAGYVHIKRKLKDTYKRKFGKASSPERWICRKCGFENNNLVTECEHCGESSSARQNSRPQETWKCDNCGYLNTADEKSCARCGTRKTGE